MTGMFGGSYASPVISPFLSILGMQDVTISNVISRRITVGIGVATPNYLPDFVMSCCCTIRLSII
jgi:hypothetical protein